MLHSRQLIPPLTLRDPHGHETHAWDFKQTKNLVIAFVHADCALCERFVRSLTEHARDLEDKEAVVLLTFPRQPILPLSCSLPHGLIAGVDPSGRSAWTFLGEDASAPRTDGGLGVFVTDRYGEISARWLVADHTFPQVREILSALDSVEIACEECYVPHWPVEE